MRKLLDRTKAVHSSGTGRGFIFHVSGGIMLVLLILLTSVAIADSLYTRVEDRNPVIATDSVGHWIGVWSADCVEDDNYSDESSLLAAYSSNDGQTWSEPVFVRRGTLMAAQNSLATDGRGTWALVTTNSLRGILRYSVAGLGLATSVDGGKTWANRDLTFREEWRLSTEFGQPAICATSSGIWVVSWMMRALGADGYPSEGNPYARVLIMRSNDGGINWENPVVIEEYHEQWAEVGKPPALATDGRGTWILAWSRINRPGNETSDADIMYSVSTDDGATWSAPVPLNTDATQDSSPGWDQDLTADIDRDVQVVTDGKGMWLATWLRNPIMRWLGETLSGPYHVYTAFSQDNGLTWTEPSQLSDWHGKEWAFHNTPRVAALKPGRFIVAWNINGEPKLGNDGDLQYVSNLGPNSDGDRMDCLNVNAHGDWADDSMPSIAVGRDGHCIAVWSSTNSLGKTIGKDADILFAHSYGGGRDWTDPKPLNSSAYTDQSPYPLPGRDDTSQYVGHVQGWKVKVWASTNDLDETIGEDWDILYSYFQDNTTWSTPHALNSDAASDGMCDSDPRLVLGDTTACIVAWRRESTVCVSRSSDHGHSWSNPTLFENPVGAEDFGVWDISLTCDGSGSWLVVWEMTGYDSHEGYSYSASGDDGQTWTAPKVLDTRITGKFGPPNSYIVGMSPGGKWIVAVENHKLTTTATDNAGDSWSDAIEIGQDEGHYPNRIKFEKLISGHDARWELYWGRGKGDQIHERRMSISADGGLTWSLPENVPASARKQ